MARHVAEQGNERAWAPTSQDIDMVRRAGDLLTIADLAEMFGVSKTTFERRMKEYPELREAYDRRKEPTPDQVRMVERVGGVLTQEQLAQLFGVSTATLQKRMRDYPDLRDAYDKAQADAIQQVGNKLLKAALDGNITAQIFFLKARAGWKDRQTVEHSGPEGRAIEVETSEKARRDVVGRLVGISRRLDAGEGSSGADFN